MEVIAAIGPGAIGAKAALVEIIRSKQIAVSQKVQAINTLASIGPTAIPDLTEVSRHRNSEIRAAAEKALKTLGR